MEDANLAWRDVHVTATNVDRVLLQGITGYAGPGTFTAIMGPSGSGKSTLLDALAGRLGKNTRSAGDILLNGHDQQRAYGISAFVTQDDTLIGTLTVRETISYSANIRLAEQLSSSQKNEIVESVIRQMGLCDCANTVVGTWHLRGLSGGEKRRLSIALEILTRPRLIFLDEPTSGLDSASAFFVVQTLRGLALDGQTVIASIHQPSSEVFELFDNLCLLSQGKQVYFGERRLAVTFFEEAGYPCPVLSNPSDHFLKIINSDFDKLQFSFAGVAKDVEMQRRSSVSPQLSPQRSPHTKDLHFSQHLSLTPASEAVDTLVKFFHASSYAQSVAMKVQGASEYKGALLKPSGTQAGFLTQAAVLTQRSFKNMRRDVGYYWLRLAVYMALNLAIGTLYFSIGTDNKAIMARAAFMFYIVAFLTFMSIGGFPSFVEDMKVFFRERLNGHYGVMTFIVSNTMSSVPFLFLIALVSTAISYNMVKLHSGFDHFIYFVLNLFAALAVVESLMMAIASLVPNFLMGIIIGAGIQGIFMPVAGFFRLPDEMPKVFWKYPLSYIAFHVYSLQGMYENDFLGLEFDGRTPGSRRSGMNILNEDFQADLSRSKWWNLGVLFLMIFLYRTVFFFFIKLAERRK